MSLSRVVYSDGDASGSPVFKRQSLERTSEGSPSQEERGGECNAVNLSFTWTTDTKTAMDGVE